MNDSILYISLSDAHVTDKRIDISKVMTKRKTIYYFQIYHLLDVQIKMLEEHLQLNMLFI